MSGIAFAYGHEIPVRRIRDDVGRHAPAVLHERIGARARHLEMLHGPGGPTLRLVGALAPTGRIKGALRGLSGVPENCAVIST